MPGCDAIIAGTAGALSGHRDLLIRLDALIRDWANLPNHAVLLLAHRRLKLINRNLGLSAGDAVLDGIAQRLTDFFHGRGRVYRLWGGKFAVLIEESGQRAALDLAQEVVAVCSAPHLLPGHGVMFLAPMIGVACGDHGYGRGDDWLCDAQFALESAYSQRSGGVALFDPAAKRRSQRAFQMENCLHEALESSGQFHVAYQPLVAIEPDRPRTILGFEALARWTHPVHGVITPDEFIPVAEEGGLIRGLGEYILWGACVQQQEWAARFNRPDLVVSVNLSPVQVMSRDIVETVVNAVSCTGIPPECLKLEVTESALVADPVQVAERLMELRRLGISVGVDDFGSGYSSLGQLDLFGLDFMKIDKSFIRRLEMGWRQRDFVHLIIEFGRNLNMSVVVEGIEEAEHLDILSQMGADIGQGYLFSRPLPVDQAASMLEAGDWRIPKGDPVI